MADIDLADFTFGGNLKDGFKVTNAWTVRGIQWLDDIQQFYRDRSVIERDYSSKLHALAKKYIEKKSRKIISLSVGDTPAITPGSLGCSSVVTWNAHLSALEQCAAEHEKYAGLLITQLADPLKSLQSRIDDLRKLYADYVAKLEKERDNSYSEFRKLKSKYDSECQDVENKRKKADAAFDYGKTKAQIALQHQKSEMNNSKNIYLIGIETTNQLKHRYYDQFVPEILNAFQLLVESRVTRLNNFWLLATNLEKDLMTQTISHLTPLTDVVRENKPFLDCKMFIQHNITPWQEPPDIVFEPSPVWHDDDLVVTDPTAKNFLRNILTKSKAQLADFQKEAHRQNQDIEAANIPWQMIREGKSKNDEFEASAHVFGLQQTFHNTIRSLVTAQSEVNVITSAVGDVSLGARNHDFKSETFKIPTNCDFCGERIWGLNAKGFNCKNCGYTCHSKCQMKTPADCPGEQTKEEKKRLKTERQEAAHATMQIAALGLDGAKHGERGERDEYQQHKSRSITSKSSRRDTIESMNNPLSLTFPSISQQPLSSLLGDDNIKTNFLGVRSSDGGGGESGGTMTTTKTTTTTTTSQLNGSEGTIRRKVLAPPPIEHVSAYESERVSSVPKQQRQQQQQQQQQQQPRRKMLYLYEAQAEGEITVHKGDDVVLLESDDGCGWINIQCGQESGLVPTSYVAPSPENCLESPFTNNFSGGEAEEEEDDQRRRRTMGSFKPTTMSTMTMVSSPIKPTSTGKKGPAVLPKKSGRKLQNVEALYDYTARTEGEHNMVEGELFVVVNRDVGNGWADVEKNGVVKSVPTNYLREV